MAHPNEAVIRGFFEAIGRRDLDAAKSHMADDVWVHLAGSHPLAGARQGPDAWFDLAARVFELTDEFRLDVHDVLANDDHGVALVHATGARGDRRLEWNRIFVYHLREGRIAEVWIHESDQAGVDALLG